MKLEDLAQEMLKVHSEETLNMLAEHFPKCFEYEIKIAKYTLQHFNIKQITE